MTGAVGPVAALLNTVAKWLLQEDGYREFSKRRQLHALRKAAKDALDRNDWDEHRRLVRELERVSDAP